MSLEDKILDQITCNLPDWKITYDNDNEKYVLTTNFNGVRLSPEEISWFKKLGLEIFSIYKNDGYLSVQFVSSGGYS